MSASSFEGGLVFKTAADANFGIDPERVDHWDGRRAVLFLRDDAKDPDVSWKAGRRGRHGEADAFTPEQYCGPHP